jgi:hypothetical protein
MGRSLLAGEVSKLFSPNTLRLVFRIRHHYFVAATAWLLIKQRRLAEE